MKDEAYSIDNEIDLSEIVGAVWAHKVLITIITGLSILIAAQITLTTEKKYTATSLFQIEKADKPGFRFPSELSAFTSLAGFNEGYIFGSNALLERITAREFILSASKKLSLHDDNFFNSYNPNYSDPAWKTAIKKAIGWQTNPLDENSIVENNIIISFKESKVSLMAFSLSVTHRDPEKAAIYANALMENIRQMVDSENKLDQDQRLQYLSETLANALQELDTAQQNLKEYTFQNSAMAQENFITGSLKLDELRSET